MTSKNLLAGILLLQFALFVPPCDAGDQSDFLFEPPVLLRADEKIIDTGHSRGHSAPCMRDLDGDGLADLLLGDFSGKFRFYRNVGAANAPVYKKQGFLQAGETDAKVWIYCCIGAQPRFHDLNGDGILDLISNSYDPGHCYVFWGLPGNRFAAREEIFDKAGVPVRYHPTQKQKYESFGSFYELVDWDNDGDLDLLIGGFHGSMKLRINEGNKLKAEFAENNIDVLLTDGTPLRNR